MLLGDAVQPARQHRHLTRHRGLDDELLALINDVAEIRSLADEARIEIAKAPLILARDEETADHVHELVAGGAVHRPRLQLLVLAENFLDHEVKWTLRIEAAIDRSALPRRCAAAGAGTGADRAGRRRDRCASR